MLESKLQRYPTQYQDSKGSNSITSQNAKLAAGGMADNPGKLAEMKKVFARIKTIAKEKNYKI